MHSDDTYLHASALKRRRRCLRLTHSYPPPAPLSPSVNTQIKEMARKAKFAQENEAVKHFNAAEQERQQELLRLQVQCVSMHKALSTYRYVIGATAVRRGDVRARENTHTLRKHLKCHTVVVVHMHPQTANAIACTHIRARGRTHKHAHVRARRLPRTRRISRNMISWMIILQ